MAKKNGNTKGGKVAGKAAPKAAKPQVVKESPKKEGSLASIIDPLLLAGGSTIKEIAAELAKKAGDAAKNRDLASNVRARCWSFKKKGWRVEKDDQKRVKVVQGA